MKLFRNEFTQEQVSLLGGEWRDDTCYFPMKINGVVYGYQYWKNKWMNVKKSNPQFGLFGYDYIEGKTIVVVEGIRDALRLRINGIPAIATSGTNIAYCENRINLLKSKANRFILAMDNDKAGRKASEALKRLLPYAEGFGYKSKDPYEMTDDEVELLKMMVNRECQVTIIDGAPGSGKSHLMIQQLIRGLNKTTLIAVPGKLLMNEISLRIKEAIPETDVINIIADVKKPSVAKQLYEVVAKHEHKKSIVVCTHRCLSLSDIEVLKNFDRLFIDENIAGNNKSYLITKEDKYIYELLKSYKIKGKSELPEEFNDLWKRAEPNSRYFAQKSENNYEMRSVLDMPKLANNIKEIQWFGAALDLSESYHFMRKCNININYKFIKSDRLKGSMTIVPIIGDMEKFTSATRRNKHHIVPVNNAEPLFNKDFPPTIQVANYFIRKQKSKSGLLIFTNAPPKQSECSNELAQMHYFQQYKFSKLQTDTNSDGKGDAQQANTYDNLIANGFNFSKRYRDKRNIHIASSVAVAGLNKYRECKAVLFLASLIPSNVDEQWMKFINGKWLHPRLTIYGNALLQAVCRICIRDGEHGMVYLWGKPESELLCSLSNSLGIKAKISKLPAIVGQKWSNDIVSESTLRVRKHRSQSVRINQKQSKIHSDNCRRSDPV